MKGIVHMLEAILVSLTFMMVVPFLLYPFLFASDWDTAQISINGQDILASMDKVTYGGSSFLQNIMQKNSSELEDQIGMKFRWLENRRMNYGIMTDGAIPDEIRVGFNCTGADCTGGSADIETEYIQDILSPAYVNGRFVNFRVFPFSYDSIGRQDMDVLFIRGTGQKDYANTHISEVRSLLGRRTGIVGFFDAAAPLNQEMDDIFGIETGTLTACSGNSFMNTDNASRPNYAVQKYFYGTGINENFTYKWGESEEAGVILWSATYMARRNDTDSDGDYEALDLDTDGDGSYELFGKQENYVFTVTSPAGSSYEMEIEEIDPDGNFFTLNFNRSVPYDFEGFESQNIRPKKLPGPDEAYAVVCNGNTVPVIVNGSDQTRWKSAWISDEKSGNDINALVKSSVMWVSDKSWWNVMRSVSREHSKISYFVSQGDEFHEPYWVELSLWYIY